MAAYEFPYEKALRAGPPRYDAFFLKKHPPMDRGHRAKIFAPFAALDGFEDTLETKNVVYDPESALSEEEQAELNRRLGILAELTRTGKNARRRRIRVTVSYFVPCADRHNDAYRKGRGSYRTLCGIVWEVGEGSLLVGEKRLLFGAIRSLDSAVFDPPSYDDPSCNDPSYDDTSYDDRDADRRGSSYA